MLKPIEKKLIIIHVVLFVICAVCRIYCQGHMEEWYYRFQRGYLYWPTLLFAKPLFYYSAGFLGAFFLARKAFREDLELPYKVLGIVATVIFVVYLILAFIALGVALDGTTIRFLVRFYSSFIMIIVDYYGFVCIPGILFGLVAERCCKE